MDLMDCVFGLFYLFKLERDGQGSIGAFSNGMLHM